MSTDKGYIKVYRDIRDHWIWNDKPYGKAQAWIDLLMLANHEEKKILFEGQLITVGKGQHMTSLTKLAERWGWSRSKVKRFLDVLKSEQMCNTKRNSSGTLITVINYGFYQDTRNTKRNTDEKKAEHARNADEHKQDTKEDTKKKEEYMPPAFTENDDADEEEGWGYD